MPTQDETAQAVNEGKRRDELLRQIGERVVNQADSDGYVWAGRTVRDTICPSCGQQDGSHKSHNPDCLLAEYLGGRR